MAVGVEVKDHLELGQIQDLPRPLPQHTLSAAFGIVVVGELAEWSRLIRPDSMLGIGVDSAVTLGALVLVLGVAYTLGRNFIGLGTCWIVDEADGTCQQITQTMFRRHIVRVQLDTVREVITERSYNGESGRLRLECTDGRSMQLPAGDQYFTDWPDLESEAERIRTMIRRGSPDAQQ